MKRKIIITAIVVLAVAILTVLLLSYGRKDYKWELSSTGYAVMEKTEGIPNVSSSEYFQDESDGKKDVRLNIDITLISGEVTIRVYRNGELYSENIYSSSTSVELLEWDDFYGKFLVEYEWTDDAKGYVNDTYETRQTNFEHIKEKIKNTIHL